MEPYFNLDPEGVPRCAHHLVIAYSNVSERVIQVSSDSRNLKADVGHYRHYGYKPLYAVRIKWK